jgi:hypothetical protein
MEIREVRWDYLAAFDERIRQRRTRPSIRDVMVPGRRFTIKYFHPARRRWMRTGPCRVSKITSKRCWYWMEEHDNLNLPPTRRVTWLQMNQDLQANRIYFLNSLQTAQRMYLSLRQPSRWMLSRNLTTLSTPGSTPSTSSAGRPAPARPSSPATGSAARRRDRA